MTLIIPRTYSPDSFFEALWLNCPDLIKRGSNRDVYEIPGHPDKVLKVSNRQCNFANWAEILINRQLKDSGDIAELISWSWSGKFIVMERLAELQPGDLKGHRFPLYLSDRKPENYGRDSSGKIKALDYASIKLDLF